MPDNLSEAEKQTYLAHTERRRERGIRLKLIRFMAEESQVEGFFSIFETWVKRWHKEGATDMLLSSMCAAEARYQDFIEAKKARRRASKAYAKR